MVGAAYKPAPLKTFPVIHTEAEWAAQQPAKRIQLPLVSLQDFNIVMTAFNECDCPQKSTTTLREAFLNAAQKQAPEWFQGYKPVDTTGKGKGGKP